jgi:hypothetical protein
VFYWLPTGIEFMKSGVYSLGAVVLAVLLSSNSSLAQDQSGVGTVRPIAIATVASADVDGFSSSRDGASAPDPDPTASAASVTTPVAVTTRVRPISKVGFDLHAGLTGFGFDTATPLARRFNLRTGADFFSYGTSFQEEGADVVADLRFRSGHASLDWFPFDGRFRLSPLLVFANDTRVLATALVPSGSTVTLNGQDYISSYTDPLHGSGSINFRKVAPGFSLGFGNIIPRSKSHFSIPVEAGFYYVGQPRLKVAFTGSACDPTQPAAIGCQSVSQDAGFQHDLGAFIARNNNNLSYASFLPILSVGIGYKF